MVIGQTQLPVRDLVLLGIKLADISIVALVIQNALHANRIDTSRLDTVRMAISRP